MNSRQPLADLPASRGEDPPFVIDPVVLEAIPAAAYICAADGTIVQFNARAAALWGRSPRPGDTDQRFCGSHRLYDLEGMHLPHDRTPMATALRTGEPQLGKEVVIERPDGSRIVALVHINALKDRGGRVTGAFNCFQDITDRKRSEEDLRASRADLDDFFENSVVPMHWVGGNGIILRANRAELDLLGYDRSEYVGRHITEFHADRATIDTILQRLASGELLNNFPARLKAKDGSVKEVLVSSSSRFRDGELVNTRCVTVDVTAETKAYEILRESEARERDRARELQTIMETAPAIIWVARDKEARRIDGNPASYDFLHLAQSANASLSAPQGERPDNFRIFADGRELAPEELPVQRAARGEAVRDFLVETRFNDGTSRYLFGNAMPLRDAGGEPSGAVSAFVDITGRIEAEKQRDLMIAELNHRVKNTLATVISIAGQSFSRDCDVDDALVLFNGRIRALAHTHTRLAEANWSGVSLKSLLLDELAPYRREDGDNARLGGPAVTLTPKCAVMLGMAVHELATNAAKYGALSVKEGSVDVSWETATGEQDMLEIVWAERGGPQVRAPERSGFGRMLIERALAVDLGGEVKLDFAADGLRCSIVIPIERNVARVA